MKKKVLVVCAALALSGGAMAQSPQISFGADIGLPMGDFGEVASLMIGPNVGFEYPMGDKLGLTAQVGYDLVMLKDDAKDAFDKYSIMPLQAGLKYYFQESQKGFYGHAQVGAHNISVTTADIDLGPFGKVEGKSDSQTNLSWAVGAGYQLEKLDIGLRYNSISPDSDAPDGTNPATYIGLRVAYLLNLGN